MAKAKPAGRGADNNGRECTQIGDRLFGKKRAHDQLNQELAENYYPMRADFTGNLGEGEDFALDLMDSYPVQARQQIGDAISAMLRQDDWFGCSSGDIELDKKPSVSRGLERMTQQVQGLIRNPKTHFKKSMKVGDQDWVTFGDPVFSWEESVERTHAVLKVHHPRDNAWALNGDGDVDVNHRKVKMSARDIMRRFEAGRWAEPHQEIKTAAEKEPDRKFDVRHCLMPADEYDYRNRGRGKAPTAFVSVYYDAEHEMTMRESPQPWFNYMIPRWWELGDHPYAFSPLAINTLPDGRMAQALAGIYLEQGEKSLDPPIIGDGSVFRNELNLWSGGFSMVDLSDGRNLQDVMTVVDTAKNMQVGEAMKQDLRAMIAEGFLLNKLMLPNTKEMTAFEVNWRTDEFRRAALPFFEPIEDEYHALILNGALQMCFQLGMLTPDDVPREIAGHEAQWSFSSPLQQVEGQRIAANFRQVVADVGSILEMDPTARTRINWGEALQDALLGDGAKPKWLPTDDELKKLSDQSKQVNDANMAADALQKGASVAADVGNATMTARNAGLAPV